MGDEEMEILSPTASFCSSKKEHSTCSVDLKRKRKLHCGLCILDVPSSKQRHRMGANIYQELIREAHNNFEQLEEKFEYDSNSFTGASYNSMATDVEVADENSVTLTNHQEQTSTSLNNYNNKINMVSVCSMENRVVKEESDAISSDLEGTLQFDWGHEIEEEKCYGFGVEHAILELEGEGDARTENMVLYSNDMATRTFFRSSGHWNLGQDAPLVKKKPTIDQEFEQYFSSFML